MNLTDEDLRSLKTSFITKEIAEAARLKRVSDAEGAEMTGRKPRYGYDYSGVAFPYFLPGDASPRIYRLRRDTPDLEEKPEGGIKEANKYLTAPGARNCFYFPPGVTPEMLDDVSIPAVITEGEKKTLACSRFASREDSHFMPVGISGVGNWRGVVAKIKDENGERRSVKGAISDFRLIEWKNRTVYLLFDSNVATNSDVAAARRRLAAQLKDLKAKVLFVDLPETENCNGIDDVLAKVEREESEAAAFDYFDELLSRATATDSTLTRKSNFDVTDDGVFWIDPDGQRMRICSKLEIVAETRDVNNQNWGRLLVFADRDNYPHRWSLPMSLLASSGDEYRRELLSHGLEINPAFKAKNLLTTYIQTFETLNKLRCVSRIGWFGTSFVFPSSVISSEKNTEDVIFQSEGLIDDPFQTRGTVEEWRIHVAMLSIGNSRLVFAICIAFASCLLPIFDEQGAGVHARGGTSLGKTTCLLVGGSVWGGNSERGFIETWRSTANGLEAVAETHNHALLCLDELKECDARTIGQTAYMLVNGMPKLRMSKGITLRKRSSWSLFFLSSGEIGLNDLIAQTGDRVYGGQIVRMIDIEADAGAGLGLFENIHSYPSANAFADVLKNNSKKYYGTAIREYLKLIIDRTDELKEGWRAFREEFIKENVPTGASGETIRVAVKFALAAFAGETARKICGWEDGEATKGARTVFANWLGSRAGVSTSDGDAAIAQIRHFLESHGTARFQEIGSAFSNVSNRVGYRRKNVSTEETEYLVFPENFRRELCKGFDPKVVASELARRGYLLKGSDDKNSKGERVDGELKRFYVLTSKIFETQEQPKDENVFAATTF